MELFQYNFKSQDSVIKVGTLILGGTVIFFRKN